MRINTAKKGNSQHATQRKRACITDSEVLKYKDIKRNDYDLLPAFKCVLHSY